MSSEVAKSKVLLDRDCDICRGYFPMIFEFTYTTKKPGDNVVSIEHCRFCPECLENIRKEFGDGLGSI